MSESSHEHVTRRTTRSHHPTPFLHWSCHVVAWDCVVIFHRCFHAPFVWHMFFKPYSYLRCASQPGPPYHEVAASNPPGQCLNALDDKHPSYLCVSELHGETNDKRVKESGKEDRKDGWIHEWKPEGTDELTQEKTRCSPRTRMLTRMLMLMMSKHMEMQSCRTLFWKKLWSPMQVQLLKTQSLFETWGVDKCITVRCG